MRLQNQVFYAFDEGVIWDMGAVRHNWNKCNAGT